MSLFEKNAQSHAPLHCILQIICDALHDLVPFEQFTKCEKHPWSSVTFIKFAGCKSNTPTWVFFTFFKLYKWYQIVQRVSFNTIKYN